MDDSVKKSTSSAMQLAKQGYLADYTSTNKPPHGVEKEAHMNRKLLDHYASRRTKWDTRARDCEKFRLGEQWTKSQRQELARQKKAPIVVNLINPAVEQLKAMLTSNEPRFNALPVKGSDRDTAKAMSDIGQHIWKTSQTTTALKEVIDDYTVKGLGYLVAYWDNDNDFGKGEVVIEDVEPYNVYVDPLSKKRDFSDARHILVRHTWTKEQIMHTFAGIKESFFNTAIPATKEEFGQTETVELESLSDMEGDAYDIIDRYSRRRQAFAHFRLGEYEAIMEAEKVDEYKKKNVFVTATMDLMHGTNNVDYALEDDEIAQTTELIEEYGTTFHTILEQDEQGMPQPQMVKGPPSPDAQNVMSITSVQIATMGQLVSHGTMEQVDYVDMVVYRVLTIGDKVYWKGYTGTRNYPVVPFCNRHKRNPYPYSDVWMSMSMQKELNVTRQHIMTHTANVASIKVAIPRGSGKTEEIEEKMGKAGISVIEYSAEEGGAPVYMYPPQLPSQLYESEKRFEESIYQQFGVYPFMGGGGEGHSTSSGTLIMDEQAQRRISTKRMDIEFAINCLGRVVIELVQKHYTEHKVIRLLKPSGRYNEVDINSPVYDQYSGRLLHRINDVTLGRYDLTVVSGSTLPSNRMMRMEYFIKLYSQGLIDQYETLKNIDEVDVEGVMERMGLLQQMQGQIEALQQEIKELQGDLQTADRETVNARKRVELEKFKAKLTQMQAQISNQLNDQANKIRNDMQSQSEDPAGAGVTVDQNLYSQLNQMT